MGLSDVMVRNAKPKAKAFKLADEKGLFLLVQPNGRKYWRFKYRYGGKERLLALGVYPEVSLKDARQKRDAARSLMQEGMDPGQTRKVEKLQRRIRTENTFKAVAEDWHEQHKAKWSAKHASNILERLEADVFPKIGTRPISEITAPEILAVVRAIESRGALEMAHRMRAFCGQIFRYAISIGKAERDVAADLRGSLKVRNPKSHARLEEHELPEFLQKLERFDGDIQTQIALQLLVITFVRTIELRGARQEEINIEKAIWTIPPERMKMRERHIVPLARQAVELFKFQMARFPNSEYVFPNRNRPQTFISENTLLFGIYRMGYHSRATAHGFRATASTILNESGFNRDVIERQLAHAERDQVRAAYNYAQYLPERTRMMQWWADYVDEARKKPLAPR